MEKSDKERAREVQFMSDTMERVVLVLNTAGEYFAAEIDSPHEDQMEAHLRHVIAEVVAGNYGDEVMMGLVTLLHRTGDAELIQQFLTDMSSSLQEEADELNKRWEEEHDSAGDD